MSIRFDCVGVLFGRDSVAVWDKENNEPVPITDETFEAIRATRSWADGIAQIAGLAAQEWLPSVERNPDGSFQIMGDD